MLGVCLGLLRSPQKTRRMNVYFAAKAQSDCTGVPDGTVIDWACRAYTICQDEQPVIIDCSENGQVYNPDIQACDEYEYNFCY